PSGGGHYVHSSILASGDEASFSGFSAVADESVHFSPPPKKRQLKGPGKGPGKNKKGKAPVKRGNNVTPSDKDKEREDEFRRIYSKLELLLDRQNSNADRYELASAPEHPAAPEEDEGEGEVDFSQYDIFGNNADDEVESEENSEEEFAYAIPKIFEDDDKFGDETHKSIAALVNAVTNRKSVITEIAKDYKVPSNSKSLAPPKVNPEIWHLLNRQARSDDLSFQTIQRILGFGIVPVIRTAEALTKPDAGPRKIPKQQLWPKRHEKLPLQRESWLQKPKRQEILEYHSKNFEQGRRGTGVPFFTETGNIVD
ncbi:Hypothetical predicted protein, partial [Mytilus galloprovincialis]